MMNYHFTIPSLLVLVIIMGYYFMRPRIPIRMNRAFLAILVIDICTVILDLVRNRLGETWQNHSPVLLWVFNLLFVCFYLTLFYMFFVFSVSVLDARGALRSRLHRFAPTIYYVCIAVELSSPATGWMYTVQDGYHPGPLHFLMYACAACYMTFPLIAMYRGRRKLSGGDKTGLVALQMIMIAGLFARFALPNYLVMDTFSLMAIMVIFLSFQNPDLFLSDRGYVFNLPAFRAVLLEWHRKKRSWRLLSFVLQNYNEHRELFGGQQMDEALALINDDDLQAAAIECVQAAAAKALGGDEAFYDAYGRLKIRAVALGKDAARNILETILQIAYSTWKNSLSRSANATTTEP